MAVFYSLGAAVESIKKDWAKLSNGLRKDACHKAAEYGLERAKRFVPRGPTKILSRSGHLAGEDENIIVFDAPYAKDIERGRLPGAMPPLAPLIKWAESKGIKDPERAAFKIAEKISREGHRPVWYLGKQIYAIRRNLAMQVRRVLKETSTTAGT